MEKATRPMRAGALSVCSSLPFGSIYIMRDFTSSPRVRAQFAFTIPRRTSGRIQPAVTHITSLNTRQQRAKGGASLPHGIDGTASLCRRLEVSAGTQSVGGFGPWCAMGPTDTLMRQCRLRPPRRAGTHRSLVNQQGGPSRAPTQGECA